MRIAYVDGPRLRRALLAASERVRTVRGELNRINVFPVPDGDTGTNLALTLRSVADDLRPRREVAFGSIALHAAEACVLGARGNVGMIFSHFLLGLAEQATDRIRLTVPEFARALRGAVEHLYDALERPVEGTILTVMREIATEAERGRSLDFAVLTDHLLERARDAVARTQDALPALRTAGVVDAGAKGFLHALEGIAGYIRGDAELTGAAPAATDRTPETANAAPAARAALAPRTDRFRYCTEALVEGDELPAERTVRDRLRRHGDSLIVVRTDTLLKVHLHTDDPDTVFRWLRRHGRLVAHKAEDMAVQHDAIRRSASERSGLVRRPVAIVSDTGCDLPDPVLRAHGIDLVPLALVYEDEVLRDRVEIDAATFARRLLAGDHPGTSQPAPADFLDVFRRAAEDAETVVAITLAATLSGTHAAAETAARRIEEIHVRVVDSRAASILQGLLVLRAAELAESGEAPAQIAAQIAAVRDRSGILFTVDAFDRLLASGRVGRGRAWLGTLLDIKPILELRPDGEVQPVAKVRGRENVLRRVLDLLADRIPQDAGRIRFGIVHVACPDVVDRVAEALRHRFGDHEIVSAAATPVIATHIGAGAWAVAYMVE